jgi:hypothetical protein
MSSYRTRKTAIKVDPPSVEGVTGANRTIELATYVGELLKGVRQLTRQAEQKDLAFLDYLLAMAEEESGCLAANIYH